MDILSKIKQPIEGELETLNQVIAQILSSDSPLLTQAVTHYLSMKGKQIRPILVLLTAKLSGPIRPETIYAAAAIELLHNASLIHDDVIDESKLRRGKATLNGIWDNRIAVLAGDYFVSSALRAALSTQQFSVIAILGELGRKLACGEMNQISVVAKKIIDETAYFKVIKEKTASLFMACTHIGAFTSGMPQEQVETLKGFGERLGICFQIKDDIFDYFATDELGKPTHTDLAEGKITLPLLYALTHTAGKEEEAMRTLALKPDLSTEEINRLTDFAIQKGGVTYAEEVMNRLRDEAVALLRPFQSSAATTSLQELFDYTLSRTK
ncbi:MAG: polyprenyl synthetase family protein [Porphyromonadaceae bacterium]|nr:polyprenyl synthetase family protein [Porphyromonadaceae bacterium]